MSRNIANTRQDFPMISSLEKLGQSYLDSAAVTQIPSVVMQAMDDYISHHHANPRRGVSRMSYEAGQMIEDVRSKVAQFIHAKDSSQIVFAKNTTESLNLVAHGFARLSLKKSDAILVSQSEHHSNFIPWQQVAHNTGAMLEIIPVDRAGRLDIDYLHKHLTSRTKLVCLAHVSNVFGTITPLKSIITDAHRVGAVVVVDGAQAAGHIAVDVSALDADFYAFSSHKMYGPDGVGILYGKSDLLEQTEPLLYGGGMIEEVSNSSATWDKIPYIFEGGTINATGIIGLGATTEYLNRFSWDDLAKHERLLLKYTSDKLAQIKGVELYIDNDITNHIGLLSFNIKKVHPHDVSEVLDNSGVTVRSGHHCAMPMMQSLDIPGTVRASFGVYSNKHDADRLITAVADASARFT